ncbi:MAG: Hpt domain-containing protein, partial [Pseudomonas gingeri]
MSFGADEEILQDFLVEAGEILEQLSEQLVELESRPDDADLLNAIFRGFHTVKGGAGFLQLNELVECCHIAENVFDILRKGERRVDSELMDVVLEALDAVNGMFSEVRERGPITAATPELLAALARLAEPAGAEEVAAPVAEVAEPEPVAESESGDITDNEFEMLLDSLNSVKAEAEAPKAVAAVQGEAGGDEITDAEFESLLDQLHGKGQFAPDAVAAPTPPAAPAAASGGAEKSSDITDDEFEALLDQLHGKGSFKVEALDTTPAAAQAAEKTGAASGDLITDQEFESLLDELHGKGKFTEVAATTAVATPAATKPAAAAPAPVAKAPAPVAATPAPAKAAPAPAAAAPAPARAPAP